MWTYRQYIKHSKFFEGYDSDDSNTNILTASGRMFLYKFLENFYQSSNEENQMFFKINEMLLNQEYQLNDAENLHTLIKNTEYGNFAPPINKNTSLVNNQSIFHFDDGDPEYRPYFTDEGLEYLKELLAPRLEQINNVSSITDLETLIENTPNAGEFPVKTTSDDLNINKQNFVDHMICWILNEYDSRTLGEDNKEIDPWSIYDYLNSQDPSGSDYGKQILKLYGGTEHKRIQRPKLIVEKNGEHFESELSRSTVLAIILVYSHMNLAHPFSMYGYKFNDLMVEIETHQGPRKGQDNFMIGDKIYNFGPYSFHKEFTIDDIKMGMEWTGCTEKLTMLSM